MGSLDDLKEQVWKANLELAEKGLVLYTFGNISGIDRDRGRVVIKPSGIPYDELTPEMMVTVDLDNNVIDSEARPSSDTKTHLVLYKNFSDIGGVAHTHSTYATSWAQARRPIPCLGTTHADYVAGEIPCTEILSDKQIDRDYEEETGVQIVDTFREYDYRYTPMVLVASHGPFTWGDSPEKAVYHSVILEELARMASLTRKINPEINSVNRALIQKHFNRKHGKSAYYGQKKSRNE
jgi:L-ribulose-5-phosphate 4-epimerase